MSVIILNYCQVTRLPTQHTQHIQYWMLAIPFPFEILNRYHFSMSPILIGGNGKMLFNCDEYPLYMSICKAFPFTFIIFTYYLSLCEQTKTPLELDKITLLAGAILWIWSFVAIWYAQDFLAIDAHTYRASALCPLTLPAPLLSFPLSIIFPIFESVYIPEDILSLFGYVWKWWKWVMGFEGTEDNSIATCLHTINKHISSPVDNFDLGFKHYV